MLGRHCMAGQTTDSVQNNFTEEETGISNSICYAVQKKSSLIILSTMSYTQVDWSHDTNNGE